MNVARWVGALAAMIILPLVLPSFVVVVLTEIAIVALFATAFNLLMGYGGMVSFGHAAYFALGAYAAALLVKRGELPMLLGLAAAPVVAAAGALLSVPVPARVRSRARGSVATNCDSRSEPWCSITRVASDSASSASPLRSRISAIVACR